MGKTYYKPSFHKDMEREVQKVKEYYKKKFNADLKTCEASQIIAYKNKKFKISDNEAKLILCRIRGIHL